MPLSDYNIEKFVKEQMNAFLQNNKFTFSELKRLILNKTLIPNIHTTVFTILTQEKNNEQLETKKAFEQQAYKKQLDEDNKQIKQDQSTASQDEELKEQLDSQLKRIRAQLNNYEMELSKLNTQLAKLQEIAFQKNIIHQQMHEHKHEQMHEHKHEQVHEHKHEQVHEHKHKQVHEHKHEHKHEQVNAPQNTNTGLDETKTAIELLLKDIKQQQLKIKETTLQREEVHRKLNQIEDRARDRLAARLERNIREQARITYNSAGQKLRETLSAHNWSKLSTNIQTQHQALEKKFEELIKETEKYNYECFSELLPRHLEHFSLPSLEIEALRAILKLMSQHLQYERQIVDIRNDLNKKIDTIAILLQNLEKLRARIVALHKDNPNLTASNHQLTHTNAELNLSLERNTRLCQSFTLPSLILLTFTFMSIIPIILLLNGVIPFFAAPVIVFTLITAPLAVLLITALITGISAAVYAYKAYSNQSEINTNKQTIDNNNSRMDKNTQELHTLQTNTVPELEIKIKQEEQIRDSLEESLQQFELLSKKTVKQARETEPVSCPSVPFWDQGKKGRLHQHTELNLFPTDDQCIDFNLNYNQI